ncbi:MAG: hypothetical protein K6G76_02625 [Lachnospiraceae bacterium]|nr:hypothetical protein [Lachnospiraceae bacterium]
MNAKKILIVVGLILFGVAATFTRVRYPNRFRNEDAVVSAEKMCPNCGGAFTPDEKGNCKFCGKFLFRDNVKWKRV